MTHTYPDEAQTGPACDDVSTGPILVSECLAGQERAQAPVWPFHVREDMKRLTRNTAVGMTYQTATNETRIEARTRSPSEECERAV